MMASVLACLSSVLQLCPTLGGKHVDDPLPDTSMQQHNLVGKHSLFGCDLIKNTIIMQIASFHSTS